MPQELPDGWREALPENIRDNGALDNIDTIDKMAEMIVNGRQTLSNAIRIPGEDAGPEKRDEFIKDLQSKVPDLVYVGEGADMSNIYDRMGRPESAADYGLKDIPDPLADNFAGLTAKAHELGLSKGQMQGITEQILGDFKDSSAKQAAALEDAVGAVKAEYGEAFEGKLAASADFAKKVGFDDSLVDAVSKGHVGLENLKALDKLMDGFNSPGPRIGDDQGTNDFVHMTPEQAEIQLAEIMNNKEHPYWVGSDPAHDAAIKKVVELTRAAEAGKPQTESEKFRDALLGRG